MLKQNPVLIAQNKRPLPNISPENDDGFRAERERALREYEAGVERLGDEAAKEREKQQQALQARLEARYQAKKERMARRMSRHQVSSDPRAALLEAHATARSALEAQCAAVYQKSLEVASAERDKDLMAMIAGLLEAFDEAVAGSTTPGMSHQDEARKIVGEAILCSEDLERRMGNDRTQMSARLQARLEARKASAPEAVTLQGSVLGVLSEESLAIDASMIDKLATAEGERRAQLDELDRVHAAELECLGGDPKEREDGERAVNWDGEMAAMMGEYEATIAKMAMQIEELQNVRQAERLYYEDLVQCVKQEMDRKLADSANVEQSHAVALMLDSMHQERASSPLQPITPTITTNKTPTITTNKNQMRARAGLCDSLSPASPGSCVPGSPVAMQAKILRLKAKNKARKDEVRALRDQQTRSAAREIELQEWVEFLEGRVSEIEAEKHLVDIQFIDYKKRDERGHRREECRDSNPGG